MEATAASTSSRAERSRGVSVVSWSDHVPKRVDSEDAMSASSVAEVWANMMRFAGLHNPSESKQLSFRLAVYVYAVKNGTSRAGTYAGDIVTADGESFNASVIPRAAGQYKIRRFFRGNMEESYNALKISKAIEREERYVAKVGSFGVEAACAFATADWMTNCPNFTPVEKKAHDASLNHGLERSKRSRNGDVLEDVEREQVDKNLRVQGPLNSYKNDDF